jgi:hypothetical protein
VVEWKNEQAECAEPKGLRGNGEVSEDDAGAALAENDFEGPEKL